ncbi:MAG TPA: hypothetical protein VFV19_09195 [Candidatus Polarisedimenticolaceae bacterium]|nr:hypothetical protein [Candidatus Polarisedimenticolaceae bacterium]
MHQGRVVVTVAIVLLSALAARPAGRDASRFHVATGPGGVPWVAGGVPRGDDPGDVVIATSDPGGHTLGDLFWIGGPGRDDVRALAVDGSGQVWIAITNDTPSPHDDVLKVSPRGDVLATWAAPKGAEVDALAVTADGGVVAAGSSLNFLDRDAALVRALPLQAGDFATSVAIAIDGSVIVGGSSTNGGFVESSGSPWRVATSPSRRLERAPDGGVQSLDAFQRVTRVDPLTGLVSPVADSDIAPVLRLLSGRSSVARLRGVPIDDASATGDGASWIVGESAGTLPEKSLAIPGTQAFLTRDPVAPTAVCPGTVNFDNSAGTGVWETPANWDTNTVPGPTDDVCIDGFTVTMAVGAQSVRTLSAGTTGVLNVGAGSLDIAQDASLRAFNLGGGAVTGAGTIVINGLFTWSNGQLSGTGTVTAAGGTAITNSPMLDGRRLINPSGQTMTYASANTGFNFANGAVLQNDGTFDSQADNLLQWTGAGTIGALQNNGTYKKSGGGGSSIFSVDVTNAGAIQAQSGTVRFSRDLASTGTVSASSGATLEFLTGTHTLNPAPAVPAGATLVADGGTVTFGGAYNPLGTTTVSSNSLTLNGSPNVLASLSQSGGTLTGPTDLSVSGSWTWSGGALSQTATGTKATALGGIALSGSQSLDGRRLVNPAGQTIAYPTLNSALSLSNGAVLQNDGTFDSQSDNTIQWTGVGTVGTLQNNGTYKKSGGTGTSQLAVTVTSPGAIQAQTGTVRFQRDFASTGAVSASSGATLEFITGTHTCTPAPTVAAGATVLIDGGLVTFGGGYNPLGATSISASTLTLNGSPNVLASLSHSGGTLTGATDLSVTGSWAWSGGSLSQTAPGTKATAQSGIALSGGPSLDGRRLVNPAGQSITFPSTSAAFNLSNGAVFQNDGTFDSQSDNAMQWTGAGTIGALQNNGTYKKSAGTGTSTLSVAVTNPGTIQAQTGTVRFQQDLGSTGTVTASSGATLEFTQGTHTLNPAPTVTAGATLLADGGAVTFGGNYDPLGATILSSNLLTLNGATNVLASLSQSGGTLTGPADFSVAGAWTWSGGTLSQTAAGTKATAQSGIALSSGMTLDGRRVVNPAGQTITFPSQNAAFNLSNGAVLQNDGTFDSQSDNLIQWTGAGTIGTLQNNGTYKKSAGTGTSTLSVAVTNPGTIQAQTGTVRFQQDLGSTGTVTASSGAKLEFVNGTQTLNPAPTVPAGATLIADGGAVTFGGAYNPLGATVLSSNLLTMNGSPNVLASLAQSGGTLTGSADFSVTGSWTWSGGALGQGASAAKSTALGGIALSGGMTLDGRRLINAAGQTITYPTPSTALSLGDGAVLQNDGTFDCQADNYLQWSGAGAMAVLENNGTFLKSAGSGVTTLALTTNNSGTIQPQTGTIRFQQNLSSTGTLTASAGATLEFLQGTHICDPAPTVPAGATVLLDGGSVTFNGAYNPLGVTSLVTSQLVLNGSPNVLASFSQTGGTLTGSADFTVSGAWGWSSGVLSQTVPGTKATGLSGIALSNTPQLDGRRLVNPAGQSMILAGTNSGFTLSNGAVLENDGTLDSQADNSLQWSGAGAVGLIENHGLLTKSLGGGTSALAVDVHNLGTIDAVNGTLQFGRDVTQTAGTTRLNGGTIGSSSSYTLQGGTIAGTGTFNGTLTNAGGAIAPGFSPGTITIAGSLVQTSGSYAVELGGLTAGTQYDRLDVTSFTGDASLGGTLDVTAIGGFTPSLGDAFTVMTYKSHNGTFSAINAPNLGPTLTWSVAYNPTAVILSVVPVANPDLAVTIGDSPDPVVVGQDLTYTITVTNSGTAVATSATLSDPLPASVAFQSVQTTLGACNQSAGTVACNFGDMAVGASATVTVVVTPSAAAEPSIDNTATAATTATDPVPANDAATATTNVVPPPTADLSIALADSPDPVNAGSNVTYTASVTNAGPDPATTVVATVAVPAGAAFVSATGTGWACNFALPTVTCTRATLAVGAAPAIAVVVTAPASGPLAGGAAVSAAEADPTLPNTATATTAVTPVADLSITNTDAPDPVGVGAALTYTITVTNHGPSNATAVAVTDAIPAGTTFQSAAGSGWTCAFAAPTVTCTRPTLAVAAAPAITLTVTAPSSGGAISDTASVSAGETDPVPANNSATAGTNVTASADLSITNVDSPDPVNAGSNVTYTITVSNAGPSAATSLIVDGDIPTGSTFQSASGTGWTCGFNAGTVTCTMPTLAVASAPAITVVVTAPASGSAMQFRIEVGSSTADANLSNNAATADTAVAMVDDLSIVKTASASSVASGTNFTYTLAVSNAGPSAASSVTVTDPLPAGLTFVSANGTGWSCSQAAGTVTCTRSSLAVGAAPAIAITVKAPASPGTIVNTATVAAAADPNAANNSSSASVDVTTSADLRITKTASAATITDGSTVTYLLSVRNLGPSTATNVVVTDLLPFEATFVSASGSGWSCTPSRRGGFDVVCTRATLGVTTAPPITIVVTVSTGGKGGTVCNSADVASDAADPVTTDNTDQVCINAVPAGTCNSVQDLIEQVDDSGIPAGRKAVWDKFLTTTLGASNLGQHTVVAQRLSLFTKQVRAAQATGAVDAETADSLVTCADALRQQATGGAGKARR